MECRTAVCCKVLCCSCFRFTPETTDHLSPTVGSTIDCTILFVEDISFECAGTSLVVISRTCLPAWRGLKLVTQEFNLMAEDASHAPASCKLQDTLSVLTQCDLLCTPYQASEKKITSSASSLAIVYSCSWQHRLTASSRRHSENSALFAGQNDTLNPRGFCGGDRRCCWA